MVDSERSERHRTRMQRKKELIDAAIARADREQGLLLVHTGNGKGKSCLLYTSPSPRDRTRSRMPSSA